MTHDEWISIGPTRRVPSAGFEFSTLIRRADLDVCLELLAADPSMSDPEIKNAARERGHEVAAESFDEAIAEARRRIVGGPEEREAATEQLEFEMGEGE